MSKHVAAAIIALLSVAAVQAGTAMPNGWGTEVYGYQDNFSSYETQADFYAGDWEWVSPVREGGTGSYTTLDVPVLSFGPDGLTVNKTQMNGANNHLLYMPTDGSNYINYYSGSTFQEVLIRVRVTGYNSEDAFRLGPAASINTGSAGLNLSFRNHSGARDFKMLDDGAAWYPEGANTPGWGTWELGQWYWVRFRHQMTNDTADGGLAAGVYGSWWPADGETAEPDDWCASWVGSRRTGQDIAWAGIQLSSGGNATAFDVSYFLLMTDGPGLSTFKMGDFTGVPEPATMSLLALGGLALLRRRR